jgi:hypothetical protein
MFGDRGFSRTSSPLSTRAVLRGKHRWRLRHPNLTSNCAVRRDCAPEAHRVGKGPANSRMVGKPYLGITSRLPVRSGSGHRREYGYFQRNPGLLRPLPSDVKELCGPRSFCSLVAQLLGPFLPSRCPS